MPWLRAGLVVAPALFAAGCSQPDYAVAVDTGGEASPTAAAHAAPDPSVQTDVRVSDPVPKRLLGLWVYSHQECEPDSEMTPDRRAIRASILFQDDGRFDMDVEGFSFFGTYRYDGGEYPRIQLNANLLNFAVDGDTLQNWSEGDAVYQCGRVFVRERSPSEADR